MTTNTAMYIPHYGLEAKRSPFRPKLREMDGARFETRSTQQDSFLPWPSQYQARRPIYPAEKPYEYQKFDHQSTSRSAYVAHDVKPFVAAKKPPPQMAGDGGLA